MSQTDLSLYKLMILYIIDRVDFPLSNSQITEFFLEREYTTYFKLQQAFHELEEDEMLRTKTVRNSSLYELRPEGKEAIDMFDSQISDDIKEDIVNYLTSKDYQLRSTSNIQADFFPAKRDEYTVRLRIKEKDSMLLELNLNVISREQAIYICDHWNQQHSDIYSYLVKELILKKHED